MDKSKHKPSEPDRQDLPCVWMMAGVLNQMICDQEYDCEHCELDRVLRKEESSPSGVTRPGTKRVRHSQRTCTGIVEDQVNQYLARIVSGSKLYLDRCYSPSHFWMYPQQEKIVVGMDTNILRILYPLTEVIPPDEDIRLKQNQYCGLLVRDDLTIPLHSPYGGTVIDVNQDYVQRIQETYPPNGDEWMFTIQPEGKGPSTGDLCQGENMLRWYVQKINLIKQYLRDLFSKTAIGEIGTTMADGGETQLNLELILGREQYRNLIREMFRV